MEWVELDQGEVNEHASSGLYMLELARLTADAHFRVHVTHVAPGGLFGRHPGSRWQLFCVVSGAGWVTGGDGHRHPIAAHQAVMWEPHESHASGTDEGMTVVMVQSPVRLPYGE